MEEIYSFSVLHIMNRNSSDSRDVYLHHQYRFIYLYICIFISIISITRAITWCWWCELCCPSWWITQTDRRGGRTTGDGTTPKTPLGHWGVLWGSLQSIKHSLWNNEGPGARGRARGCSGLIWRPKGAHSGLSLPDVHLQLPTSIFLCYSHQNLNWYHLKSAHFFLHNSWIMFKSLQHSQPKHVCSSSTCIVILLCAITYKVTPQSRFSLFGI